MAYKIYLFLAFYFITYNSFCQTNTTNDDATIENELSISFNKKIGCYCKYVHDSSFVKPSFTILSHELKRLRENKCDTKPIYCAEDYMGIIENMRKGLIKIEKDEVLNLFGEASIKNDKIWKYKITSSQHIYFIMKFRNGKVAKTYWEIILC